MPAAITRNLHLCFSRAKIPSFSTSLSSSSPSGPLDSTRQNPDSVPSSPCSSSSAIFKNFNSLYGRGAATSPRLSESETSAAGSATSNRTQTVTKATTATAAACTVDADSDGRATATAAAPPFSPEYCTEYLSSAMASRRLLPPSSPRRSKAIADPAAIAVGVWVAVPICSTDPYGDFRRSMEQMADEMGLLDQCSRRERLPELLLCYLVLNRKNAHKYIVGAFVDLMAAPVEPAAAAWKPYAEAKEGGRHCSVTVETRRGDGATAS